MVEEGHKNSGRAGWGWTRQKQRFQQRASGCKPSRAVGDAGRGATREVEPRKVGRRRPIHSGAVGLAKRTRAREESLLARRVHRECPRSPRPPPNPPKTHTPVRLGSSLSTVPWS